MNDTKVVQQECGICLLVSSTGRARTHSSENHRWSAHDHKIIGEGVSNPLRIQTKMPDRCTKGRMEEGIRPPPVETKILGAPAVPKAQKIRPHPAPVGSPVVRKIQPRWRKPTWGLHGLWGLSRQFVARPWGPHIGQGQAPSPQNDKCHIFHKFHKFRKFHQNFTYFSTLKSRLLNFMKILNPRRGPKKGWVL